MRRTALVARDFGLSHVMREHSNFAQDMHIGIIVLSKLTISNGIKKAYIWMFTVRNSSFEISILGSRLFASRHQDKV